MAEDADRLEGAIAAVYAEGKVLTRDQGGVASTEEFCEAVRANL
jgi:isocitrate/isopropylmalate dehydrogenase